MEFTLHYELEEDGRWLAEVLELPGVLAYGRTLDAAIASVKALARRVVADKLEHGEELAKTLTPVCENIAKRTGLTPDDL